MKWESFHQVSLSKFDYHQQVKGGISELSAEAWENNLYQVLIRRNNSLIEDLPMIVHLSIRRLDRSSVHDWRHLQRIKNELLGEDYEAVELYPKETRVVDTSNQYHLWAYDSSEYEFPFGYRDRLVTEGDKGLTRQRPFEEGFRSEDCQNLNDL